MESSGHLVYKKQLMLNTFEFRYKKFFHKIFHWKMACEKVSEFLANTSTENLLERDSTTLKEI